MAEIPLAMTLTSDRPQQDSLLVTKLYIPRVSSNLVPRPRLIERMNEGMQRKLTLISAPAGFGKTTLIAEWLKVRMETGDCLPAGRARRQAVSNYQSTKVGWISLDKGDNDPVRFWGYFVAALRTIEASIGEVTLSAFQARQPPPMESILTALINEIAAVPDSFALVLDDYHLIEAQPIHDAVAFLLDYLPGNMHLVIATRSDPPLPLTRLRGRGQLTELRATDLRFTPDEAATFLNQVMGLDLRAQHIAALETRTEGWIAGLQLAALSMQGREDIPGFIAAFTGGQHYILDYLVEEVLQRQSEGIQAFLLQTSILERMTGPLCDAVVGETLAPARSAGVRDWRLEISHHAKSLVSDLQSPISNLQSQAILDYLEHANLFVVPLDERQEWYRYHRLFADFLRARLHQTWPDRVPELHYRASDWYEQNGLMAEAIEHALSARDFERAARLAEHAAEATMMRSEVATLLRWAEALPDDMIHARPLLCVYHAVALLLSGRPLGEVEAHLQDGMEADIAGAASGAMAVFRGLIAAYQGDSRQSTELAQQALELLPAESLFLRSLVVGYLGLNYLYRGDVVLATRAFREAVRVSQEAGNVMNTVLALCHLGDVSRLQGQLYEARVFYQQALDSAIDSQGKQQPIAGMARIGLGQLWLEGNELEAATHHLIEGIELIKKWGEVAATSGYIGLARVKQAQGDMAGAHEAMQMAQELAMKFDAMKLDDILVGMCKANLEVAQGNIEAALRWVEERGLDRSTSLAELGKGASSDSLPLLRAVEYMTLARVCIAQRQPGQALDVLKPLLQTAEAAGWMAIVIEILILESLAYQTQGDVAQAITTLERALSLAEPEGYVRIFIGEGAPLAELLRQTAVRGIMPNYVRELLAALGIETKDQGPRTEEIASRLGVRPAPLIEPLSERELEVLGLIAAGQSNREIAEELVVAVSTIKTHVNNIYRKLNVSSRIQAVARARELNLV